jgi:hypothetical protein
MRRVVDEGIPALFEADTPAQLLSSFRKARGAYPEPSQAALEAALSGFDVGAAGFRLSRPLSRAYGRNDDHESILVKAGIKCEIL